jgi:GT2 family glycosyltransferase
MRLAVVIVNYNVGHYLSQALHSLYKSLASERAEIYVVDNNSTDGSRETIKRLFPEVNYIYNDANVGFARACNQAIRLTEAEYVLLLNPDTIVPEGNITAVLQFMESHPEAGACGVKMIDGRGRFLPESKRGFPTISAATKRLICYCNDTPGYYTPQLDNNETHSVDVLAGAYMMIRHTALKAIGLLDEDYFMFGEDIELSVRLTEAGYVNYYLPLPIVHFKGESTNRDSRQFVRNFYGAMGIFIRKHRDRYPLLARPAMTIAIHAIVAAKYVVKWAKRNLSKDIRRERAPRFIIFTDETGASAVRSLLKRNGVERGSHYVISNERTATRGHFSQSYNREFTHVVYDSSLFSYEYIVRMLEANAESNLRLAVYHRDTRCIITSKKVYTI